MIIVTTDIIRGGNNFGDTFDVNTIDEAIFILENSFSLTNVNVIKNYKLNTLNVVKGNNTWGAIFLNNENEVDICENKLVERCEFNDNLGHKDFV